MSVGGFSATFPVTASHGWQGRVRVWIQDGLFLNNVKLTLLFFFRVGHNLHEFVGSDWEIGGS